MSPDVIYLGDNLDFDPEATQSLGEGDGPRLGISRDSLLKHTTILGGTGSGKTVLAKVMLEELALSGVPSIVIDLQGDLAKLAEKPIEDQRADQDTLDAWRKGTEARVWTPRLGERAPNLPRPILDPAEDRGGPAGQFNRPDGQGANLDTRIQRLQACREENPGPPHQAHHGTQEDGGTASELL